MKPVLIIGSVHLDILADIDSSTFGNIDKIGSMKIALGGSAYNIAVNLSLSKIPVNIITVVKKNSLSSKMILDSLHEKSINTEYVLIKDSIPESGFVAHMHKKDLISAVSSTAIEQTWLEKGFLEHAIAESGYVVIDCNLNRNHIKLIRTICSTLSKELFVSPVSESKVDRIFFDTEKDKIFYKLISLNAKEAGKFSDWETVGNNPYKIMELCKSYHSEIVIITNGNKGYSVFEHNGSRFDFNTPFVPFVKSSLGAGDALLAAVVYHYCKHKNFNWTECETDINNFIAPILGIDEATIGASQILTNPLEKSFFGTPEKPKTPFDIFILTPFRENFFSVFRSLKPVFNELNLSSGTAGDFFGINTIIKDVWSGIYHSKIVIAECTGRNPNVFYEIGIAHTLGKPTILLTQNITDIPSDLIHLRAIKYEDSEDGIKKLHRDVSNCIKEILKDRNY